MKGWLLAVALTAVMMASGLGLWVTWDSTQVHSSSPVDTIADLSRTRAPEDGADPASPTSSTTTTPPKHECVQGSDPVKGDPARDWSTIVVDTGEQLPPDFTPPDLVGIGEAGFEGPDQVRAIVINDLRELREGAEANGTPIMVVSGFRSFEHQANLHGRQVEAVGEEEASKRTARPGHSEHQLGTTVDVLNPEAGELTVEFAATPAGRWVADHAPDYGFVLSYPAEARDRTCYAFEPWHLRYVGRKTAGEIQASGKTPREWMLARRAG